MSQDSSDTVYAVAFGPEGFLMVYNPKRKGWEMPGGHVKVGESREDAARREFTEEAGYEIDIRGVYDLGYCRAFAAVLGRKVLEKPEMKVGFFTEIPSELVFAREEYELIIPWAESVSRGRGT